MNILLILLDYLGRIQEIRNNEDSDLELLISFNEVPSLFGFISLENKLSELLDFKVGLGMEDALKPEIGKRSLKKSSGLENGKFRRIS